MVKKEQLCTSIKDSQVGGSAGKKELASIQDSDDDSSTSKEDVDMSKTNEKVNLKSNVSALIDLS